MTIKKTTKKKPAKINKADRQSPGSGLLSKGKSVKELSPQHDRFCREYIIDENGVRSYQRAYPNSGYNSARDSAAALLAKPCIKAHVEDLRAARNKRLEISGDKVLRRLEARGSFSMTDLFAPDGSFIPIHELDPDVAIGIKSIEVAELFAGQGDQKQAIGIIRKITCLDGKASDELLGKHLKLWKETGSDDNPLVIINKIELVPLTSSKKS